MKKTAVLLFCILSAAGLAGCSGNEEQMHASNNTEAGTEAGKTMLEMELGPDYDALDPFVNARLFCVSEDMDTLEAELVLQMILPPFPLII